MYIFLLDLSFDLSHFAVKKKKKGAISHVFFFRILELAYILFNYLNEFIFSHSNIAFIVKWYFLVYGSKPI